MSTLQVREVDYLDPRQAAELVDLLDAYARDSAGGGQALSDFTRSNLPAHLAARPAAFSVMAYDGEKPVGLVNCIEGFSTFACRPLVNVHDVVVIASHRGAGVGRLMLERVIELSHRRGACKLGSEEGVLKAAPRPGADESRGESCEEGWQCGRPAALARAA